MIIHALSTFNAVSLPQRGLLTSQSMGLQLSELEQLFGFLLEPPRKKTTSLARKLSCEN